MNTVNEDRNYLVVAIDACLNQIGCDVELLISTVEGDKNINFIKEKYPSVLIVTMPLKDHPLSTVGKSPKGSFLQLNNALPYITGDWFTFASGNDFLYSNKFSLEIECCKNQGKEVCYSAYDYVNDNGDLIKHQYFHDYDFDKHMIGNFVADCSMISRRLVDKYLPFKVELNNYAYWDLWLRIRKEEGNVFTYNPVPVWGYRQDTNSMHVKRSKSPELIEVAKRDRDIMLALHK